MITANDPAPDRDKKIVLSFIDPRIATKVFPTTYFLVKTGYDKVDNFVMEFIRFDEGRKMRMYILVESDRVQDFASAMASFSRNLTFSNHDMGVNVVFYFPEQDDLKSEMWMCNLVKIVKSGSFDSSNIIEIILEWTHQGERVDEAVKKIREFSESDEIQKLSSVMKALKKKENSCDPLKNVLATIEEKLESIGRPITFETKDPVTLATQILGYEQSESPDFMKIKNPLDYIITIEMTMDQVDYIIDGING